MPLDGPAIPDLRPAPSRGGVGRAKRVQPTKASAAVVAAIREVKCRSCRLCGTPFNVNAHHLIPRSRGGRWHVDNLVGLCGSGTTGCHGLVEARDPAACYLLRARLTDSEYAYVIGVMGEGWLDRRLPIEGAA